MAKTKYTLNSYFRVLCDYVFFAVVPSKSAPETVKYQKKTVEGFGMYCITYGSGKNRKSMTRHCSEAQAEKIVDELTKQGL